MLGVALTRANYTSSVIPIIIGVFILAYVQRFLERVIPEVLKIILVPGISLLVMVPAVFMVFGPVGIYLGNIIHFIYTGLMGISPVLCGGFIGGMWLCVCYFWSPQSLGTHWNPGCGTERPAKPACICRGCEFFSGRGCPGGYDADQKQGAKSSGGIGISGSLCLRHNRAGHLWV